MSKILVISPSGNLYGSEQVLIDYLKCTNLGLDIMVPEKSDFAAVTNKLLLKHHFFYFNNNNLKLFYVKLFIQLLIGKYNTVYLNEAGHNKYILLLAKFFTAKRFVIHVRIIEDTQSSRWQFFSKKNTHLISISKNIKEALLQPSSLIYDLYIFSKERKIENSKDDKKKIIIGIIGRITHSKGLVELVKLMTYIETHKPTSVYMFKLYGDIPTALKHDIHIEQLKANKRVEFMGFVGSKKDIYNNIDIVLHLSKTEPLGRIFLEAIDEKIPFIGFNSAGIGEIGNLTALTDLLCNPLEEQFEAEMFEKLERVKENYQHYVEEIELKKQMAETIFSTNVYTTKLDNILAG